MKKEEMKKINAYITQEKEQAAVDVKGWGHTGKAYEEVLNRECLFLDNFVEKIITTIETKDSKMQEEILPYFENLSNNRRTAFIFRTYTGIATGTSNKEGIKAFIKCFGTAVINEVKLREDRLKEDEAKKEADAKSAELKAKNDEQSRYFSNPLWDLKKISNLSALQKANLKKALEQLFRFNGEVFSLKAKMESEDILNKKITNKMCNWNRIKFSRMDGDEQREYERKLIKGRLYHYSAEDYMREIPKLVFDALAVEDATDIDELDR